ncbi:hypothetical protein O0235_12760 [Tepidiforma flava]|uniref:Uncharacterized protein n=1 Tax=Tepidiforma flava TaxID=3004094 RepID=A0ABY7M784_9CHLR|nr:hypothetical protein [Tepidiforma flava]WBL35636.1 hypothetical protein O0235_12760 [Tepidiforma flava]
MSTERPRRRRRVDAPASSLPRPAAAPAGVAAPAARRPQPHHPQPRAHHVTRDYSYVRRDLLGILVVGLISLGFIGVMSFVVQ